MKKNIKVNNMLDIERAYAYNARKNAGAFVYITSGEFKLCPSGIVVKFLRKAPLSSKQVKCVKYSHNNWYKKEERSRVIKKILFFGVLILVFSGNSAEATAVVLDNVPRYVNGSSVTPGWKGCTPTAVGSIMAYWDSQPGFEDFYKKGDAQVWSGDGTTGAKAMVASQRYLNSDLGSPDSIASFLGTNRAGSTPSGPSLASAMEAYAAWDDTSSYDLKDGYQSTTSYAGGGNNFDDYKAEIDAGRPVLVGLERPTSGHSAVAYGYDDSITFSIMTAGNWEYVTFPGFAIMDDWYEGRGSQSGWGSWLNNNGTREEIVVQEYFDADGVEWWPWIPRGTLISGEWSYRVSSTTFFEPVPEPSTILLFGFGAVLLKNRKNR